MNDIKNDFATAAEIYAQRLRDAEKAQQNPQRTANNAQAFANHLEAQLQEQHDNGMRLNINNL